MRTTRCDDLVDEEVISRVFREDVNLSREEVACRYRELLMIAGLDDERACEVSEDGIERWILRGLVSVCRTAEARWLRRDVTR